jgi:hypothetical protein
MRTLILATALVLSTGAQAQSIFDPPPGVNPMIDFQNQMRAEEKERQVQRESDSLRDDVQRLRAQQGKALPVPPSSRAPAARPRHTAGACWPTPAEQKALTGLYAYFLASDASRKAAEAKGQTFYGSNYGDGWHDGTDPARKAYDRLKSCGYEFPTL